ncbi:phosphoglycerate mutase family protein [Hymenobacter canadensis]|uniref:Phosphoglycerate mutase family protein n=1 Tax=Hymenobacter canadensis TaxID=2999067 RepID=A0ABY7LQZ2_9BACT|nr:phosphoglycerate mutase family protein [Hymenobacter canadensis]WBA42842.1 phosphoglycerate mutase family protein [Hymenobacter canadensis]
MLTSRPAAFRLLLWLLPLWLAGSGCASSKQTQATNASYTTVYVVRHAEKDLTPGLADPPLTPAGQQRAQALRDTLRKTPLDVVFSTNTSRTRTTAEPLAALKNQQIMPYDAKQMPALAASIRRDYQGRTVLVVGHSNTILETVEALGAPRPVPAVGDNEYDYLLEVHIPKDSTRAATATARRYGVRSAGQ